MQDIIPRVVGCFKDIFPFLDAALLQKPKSKDFILAVQEEALKRGGTVVNPPPCVRMPLGSDTKYVHRFMQYEHMMERFQLFASFISKELTEYPNLPSLHDVAENLHRITPNQIASYVDEVKPLYTLLKKYSDQSLGMESHKVGYEVTTAIARSNPTLQTIFQTRWDGESGKEFYFIARLLDPNQLKAEKRRGEKTPALLEKMQHASLCAILPAFEQVSAADWDAYVTTVHPVVLEGTLLRFWQNYSSKTLSVLALDILYTSPSCTLCDSVLSVGASLFPRERQSLSDNAVSELLMHKANGDLLSLLPTSSKLRRGFPGILPFSRFAVCTSFILGNLKSDAVTSAPAAPREVISLLD